MREYETVFLIRPDASESQTKELLEKVDGIIGRHSGTVFQQKNWGKRELAYKVEKYHQGIYFYYDYAGDNAMVADIEHALKLHDLPMKYLTVKLNDEVDVAARKKAIEEIEEKKESTPVVAASEVPAAKISEVSSDDLELGEVRDV